MRRTKSSRKNALCNVILDAKFTTVGNEFPLTLNQFNSLRAKMNGKKLLNIHEADE